MRLINGIGLPCDVARFYIVGFNEWLIYAVSSKQKTIDLLLLCFIYILLLMIILLMFLTAKDFCYLIFYEKTSLKHCVTQNC